MAQKKQINYKVSVVMTTFNGVRFLLQMMDSLKNQTRKIDEVLIFDDKSTDNTVALIEEYIAKNALKQWHLIQNENNIGWERNFLQAIESASGDLVFPCDQDDVWHSDKICKMVEAFEENDDIWLLVSGYHAVREHGGKVTEQLPVRTENDEKVSKIIFDEKYYQILRPGCTMGLRKDLIPILRELWFPGTPHDAALWTISALIRKLYLYDETFIEFRRHDSNASKDISHGFKYKVNEIERTQKINDWYLNSVFYNESLGDTVKKCQIWCQYRKQFLVNKKFSYWFRMFPYRKYYLSNKKYLGDVYYFLAK